MGRRTGPTLLAVAIALAAAPSAGSSGAATLSFKAALITESLPGACAPTAPSGADCRTRTGKGLVSGLGSVTSSYSWLFDTGDCSGGLVKPLATDGRLIVAGKGELTFTLAEGARCVDSEPVRDEPQTFTITGGRGVYQGATGQGTVERSLGGGHGTEWWIGTVVVGGVEFDLTAPTIAGAVARTVRAPARATRVRVRYRVTAQDAVDGAVPVACEPPSGSFFHVGRTSVSCRAGDKSGNVRTARFLVTVRR
jgi:hypothetical protein